MKSKESETPEILIVEDSPTQAMELKLTLEQYGFSSEIAGNGREALKWLSENNPAALVISDVMMPELDGYELCRAVRSNRQFSHLPVVLLTCLSDVSDIIKGLESGASNFIVKPYNIEYLISYIRKELSRRGEREIRSQTPFAVEYGGKEFLINSNVQQIVDILVTTYGMAVHKNEELLKAETELKLLNENLEQRVKERTEELRKNSEKLEQSNQDLQDFAFIASHDLQEPVRKIQTFIDRLKNRCEEMLDETGRDYLDRVGRSAFRMRELVSALLNYSRVTSNPIHFPEVDLTLSVREALSDLKLLREDSDAQIEIGNLPTLEADPVQMRQLFQNLLENALKYRGEQMPIIRIFEEFGDFDGFHQIRVEDNGIGFEECYVEKIFKPFQRLHTKSQYEGTGIGLSICKRIVERHGGSITAFSKEQIGSTFLIRLPGKQS